MEGADGLRDALLKHKDALLTSFTESLMTYALGRRVEAYDMPTVRAIVRDAAEAGLPDCRRSSQGVVEEPGVPDEPARTPTDATTRAEVATHAT